MTFDYSQLLKSSENNYFSTWEDIYDNTASLADNFYRILLDSVYLPFDFYKIITAYAFIPSALARVVPYLSLWGVSGSGKSTIGKLIAHLHGIDINSSSDTFAAIRNSLEQRRYQWIEVPSNDPDIPIGANKKVEANTIMVWDDIDPSVFGARGDLYRLFKFGYDKSCDKIEISSDNAGENLVFHCFCPKVFSSISPLHTNEDFKELRRRLIVIPTKRIEDLPLSRQQELGIEDDKWQSKLIDISNLDWTGFSDLYKSFWDLDRASLYLQCRKLLASYIKGLTSQEKQISIDLITTGVVAGIWNDEDKAIADMKRYFAWFKGEIKLGESPINQLIKKLVKDETINALNGGTELIIYNQQLKASCDVWLQQGFLLDKPSSNSIKEAMYELGFRLILGGKWIRS